MSIGEAKFVHKTAQSLATLKTQYRHQPLMNGHQ